MPMHSERNAAMEFFMHGHFAPTVEGRQKMALGSAGRMKPRISEKLTFVSLSLLKHPKTFITKAPIASV